MIVVGLVVTVEVADGVEQRLGRTLYRSLIA
jgi:hypothetical protein